MDAKKKTVLVFGITGDYVFALANTLIGLVKHNKKFWDDIVVFYNEISEEDINNLNKIVKCTFINFTKKEYLEKIPNEVLEKYSEACFFRYECFELLKEYETVIWNDVDILIKGDISGLLEYGKKTGFAATHSLADFNNEANFKQLIPEYNMFVKLYNSGIIVLKDNLPRYEEMRDWCVAKTIEYGEILRWPDQGIINILLQEFNITVESIDYNKYCCHPLTLEHLENAAIIHAYGDQKFWNCDEYKTRFNEWEENDKKWKSISTITKKESKKKKPQPLISCVMSTYNRYEYVPEAVESILSQTYSNFELIVVLEKCENQEKIEKILKKYNDHRIIIIKNTERLGFSKSLNVGFDIAKGKYIARMDDDDISLPQRFEKQVEFLENNPDIGICGTNAKFFGKYNTVIGVETDPETLKTITLFRTPFIHPTVMMNRELINKYKLRYDPNYFTEDYELWSRAVACFPISNIDEILLHYRANGENLTSGDNEDKIHNSHKKIMKNQFENYLKINPSENEIELIQGRKSVFEICYNFDQAIIMKKSFCTKIIEANKKCNFYDKQTIQKVFWNSQFNTPYNTKNSFIKKSIKFIVRPIYLRLMNRIESVIVEHDNRIYNYINYKIEKITQGKDND